MKVLFSQGSFHTSFHNMFCIPYRHLYFSSIINDLLVCIVIRSVVLFWLMPVDPDTLDDSNLPYQILVDD